MLQRYLTKAERDIIVAALSAIVDVERRAISMWARQPKTEEALAALQAAKERASLHGSLASKVGAAEQVDLWYDG